MLDLDYIKETLRGQEECNEHFLSRYVKTLSHWDAIDNVPEENYPQGHHAIPRWMGGKDDESNILIVPVRIHLYLHKLLYLITKQSAALCSVLVFSRNTEERKNPWLKSRIVANVRSYLYDTAYEDWTKAQSELTKGTTWMNDGQSDRRVKRMDIPSRVASGWTFGRQNSSTRGKIMTFDLVMNKWVKIPVEVRAASPERYECGVSNCWDADNQPDYPFVVVTGARKDIVKSTETLRSLSELVRLEDGRYIHKDHYDPSMRRYKHKRKTPNHKWKGVYHTPYGNFVNIWRFEEETGLPHNRPADFCMKPDSIVSNKSPLYSNEHPDRTYRDLGWYFTPADQVDDQLLDSVIGLSRD